MLKIFPFLNDDSALQDLKAEFSSYLVKAADVSPEIDILLWWKNHSVHLPQWSAAVRVVVLVQLSSAAAERVLSNLKASFSPQQDHSLQDYFNHHWCYNLIGSECGLSCFMWFFSFLLVHVKLGVGLIRAQSSIMVQLGKHNTVILWALKYSIIKTNWSIIMLPKPTCIILYKWFTRKVIPR